MDTNESVWHYYQPGYVHPAYIPYIRKVVKDRWGNEVNINTWERQGCKTNIYPELVRVNKGMSFMRMFDTDPCPNGWEKVPGDDPNRLSMCVQAPLKHEPVFYTDKAFIAQRQFWNGPTVPQSVPRRISEPTDMRSIDPLTGNYIVYYEPVNTKAPTRYAPPVPPPGKYDQTWALPSKSNQGSMPMRDSYLG